MPSAAAAPVTEPLRPTAPTICSCRKDKDISQDYTKIMRTQLKLCAAPSTVDPGRRQSGTTRWSGSFPEGDARDVMKIISAKLSVVALPCSMGGPPPLFAGKPWDHLEMLLVRVETEDGLVGWGEAFGHAAILTTKSALDSIVAPLVLGRDAGDINALTRDILHSVHLLGRNGAVCLCVLRCRDRAVGHPRQAHWPAAVPTARRPPMRRSLPPIPACCTTATQRSWRRTRGPPVRRGFVTSSSTRSRERTCWPPAAPPERPHHARRQLRVVRAGRARDGAVSRQRQADVARGTCLAPRGLRRTGQVRECGIPIAAGENAAGLFGFKSLIEAGALDIAQPSVTKIGGIGEMLAS